MKNAITVIITVRNREAWRIVDQVTSIRKAGANPHFHIVDYGSDENYSKSYEKTCAKLDLQYTHMYSEGLPWNKCKAINYGAKVATTPYIVTSDVDMIYEGNPFQWCLDNYKEKNMYHIETFWLPKNGSKINAKHAGHGNSGGFQFIEQKAFDKCGGYDEKIVYWGAEDLDWPARLSSIGYTQEWLPDDYKIYHQWHQKENGSSWKRPITTTHNTLTRLYSNKINPILANEWGSPIAKENRPVLHEMHNNKPYIIAIDFDQLLHFSIIDTLLNTRSHKFVKLKLGKRIKPLNLQMLKEIAKVIFKPSASFQPRLNINFDSLYSLLPLLQDNGLKDYYITADLSEVYLLWD